MLKNEKIILRDHPLFEISFDNIHIHIVDFEESKNNEVFYLNDLIKIELHEKFLLFESPEKELKINLSDLDVKPLENFISEVKVLKSSKSLLYPKELYKQETLEDFKKRYDGYGKGLYERIKKENPKIFSKLKFYQKLDDKEDSIAEYIDDKVSFIIYLEYYSDKIEISNHKTAKVIGFWEKDEIKKAMNFIVNDLLKN